MFINLIAVHQPLIYDCERTGSGSNEAETVVVCSVIIYSIVLLMLYGVMQNNPPPPGKNIYSIYKARYIMILLKNIHVLYWIYPFVKNRNEWWKSNSDHIWNWMVIIAVVASFIVCLLLINRAILEHLPNTLHWCTLKSKTRPLLVWLLIFLVIDKTSILVLCYCE